MGDSLIFFIQPVLVNPIKTTRVKADVEHVPFTPDPKRAPEIASPYRRHPSELWDNHAVEKVSYLRKIKLNELLRQCFGFPLRKWDRPRFQHHPHLGNQPEKLEFEKTPVSDCP